MARAPACQPTRRDPPWALMGTTMTQRSTTNRGRPESRKPRESAASKSKNAKARQRERTSNADSGEQPCVVVGIGASAGGYEAISELLQHLAPKTEMAYVFV